MTNSTAKTLGEDLDIALPHDVGMPIGKVVREAKRAAGAFRADAQVALSGTPIALSRAARALAAETRERSADAVKSASRKIKAHPVAAAVALITAAGALAGLVFATWRLKAR